MDFHTTKGKFNLLVLATEPEKEVAMILPIYLTFVADSIKVLYFCSKIIRPHKNTLLNVLKLKFFPDFFIKSGVSDMDVK